MGLTCQNLICEDNEECSPCGLSLCNTWTCLNPTPGATIQCDFECENTNPTCICKPENHRSKTGLCVPLVCPSEPTSWNINPFPSQLKKMWKKLIYNKKINAGALKLHIMWVLQQSETKFFFNVKQNQKIQIKTQLRCCFLNDIFWFYFTLI